MTSDGNHGGATDEETAAALMLFSKQPLFYSGLAHELGCPNSEEGVPSSDPTAPLNARDASHESWFRAHHTVHQVDLVPTLAYWLGLPIPFGNIGSVVPDAIFNPRAVPVPSGMQTPANGPLPRMHRPPSPPVGGRPSRGRTRSLGRPVFQSNASMCPPVHESASQDGLAALAANAWQVRRYLHSYAEVAPSFSARERNELDELFARGQEASNPKEAQAALTRFLQRAAVLCRVAWTQFDLPAMTRGIVLLGLAAVVGLSDPRMESLGGVGWTRVGLLALAGGVAAWVWSPQLAREEMEPLVQAIMGDSGSSVSLGFRWTADDTLALRPWVSAVAPSLEPVGDMALGSSLGSACLATMLFLCGRSLWAWGSDLGRSIPRRLMQASFPEVAVVLVAAFRLYILFSNSYIVAENNVVLYLLNTLILVRVLFFPLPTPFRLVLIRRSAVSVLAVCNQVMGYWLVQLGERPWTAVLLTLVAAGSSRVAREFDTHAQEGIRASPILFLSRAMYRL